MDISDNYDPQPQNQGDQLQQQHMQCDPIHNSTATNGFGLPQCDGTGPSIEMESNMPLALELPMSTAIPLPAPPSYGISKVQSQAPPQPTSTDIDIDSFLLHQFSCLGTTDHEDLISQFQSLMNNQMNKDSAKFFLEMSNWNLQTAVGCYLDFCNFQTLPSMKIVHQTNPGEYRQSWRLQNDGNEDWPNGCYLMSTSQKRRIEVPVIKPGDTCDIVAELPDTKPAEVAVMWRLCTPNGWYFGEAIWMVPQSTLNEESELVERMSQLRATPENCPQVNIVITVNME